MSSPATPDPADRSRRAHPDPLTMTAAEKLIAEWEARHDVIARGGRGAPGGIEQQLSRTHAREACDQAAEPPHPPRPRATARRVAPEPPTSWWLRPLR